MKLINSPEEKEFEEIMSWLHQEWMGTGTGSGFYSNRNLLEEAFEKGKLITFKKDNRPVGFIIWSEHRDNSQLYIELDIMAIHPDYRRMGIGGKFYKLAENYFFEQEAIAVKLFCDPVESELFWKAMGFQKFPTGLDEPSLTYYKSLIKRSDSSIEGGMNKLELWDLVSFRAPKIKPKWIWNVDDDFEAIIQPCSGDWCLRLTLNNKIVKESMVKRFTSKKDVLRVGSFLYINRQLLSVIKKNC